MPANRAHGTHPYLRKSVKTVMPQTANKRLCGDGQSWQSICAGTRGKLENVLLGWRDPPFRRRQLAWFDVSVIQLSNIMLYWLGCKLGARRDVSKGFGSLLSVNAVTQHGAPVALGLKSSTAASSQSARPSALRSHKPNRCDHASPAPFTLHQAWMYIPSTASDQAATC